MNEDIKINKNMPIYLWQDTLDLEHTIQFNSIRNAKLFSWQLKTSLQLQVI